MIPRYRIKFNRILNVSVINLAYEFIFILYCAYSCVCSTRVEEQTFELYIFLLPMTNIPRGMAKAVENARIF